MLSDANDPSRHFASANYRIAKALLDHLVGDREQTRWNGKPHRFGGSHIDDEVELGRLRDRKLARFLAFEDASHIPACWR